MWTDFGKRVRNGWPGAHTESGVSQCRDLNELRRVLTMQGLDRHVIRLRLDMTVSLSEESEVERIIRDLQGTDATHGRVGVLVVDQTNLRLRGGAGDASSRAQRYSSPT